MPSNEFEATKSFYGEPSFQDGRDSQGQGVVEERNWMCTVNLKDAYLSVSITRQHRKFLSFMWEGTTFKFTCLPFSAPRIFTKVLRPVMPYLHFQGLRTVIYLDDILVPLVQQMHYVRTIGVHHQHSQVN